jgi:hypothetical protein
VRRSCDSDAEIKCALSGDVQASVRRSSGDAGNQNDNRVARADAGAANRAGDKIDRETKLSGARGWLWNKVEREIKRSDMPNGMGEEIEPEAQWLEERDRVGDELRWTMWNERDQADEIKRMASEGEMRGR